MTRTSYLSHAIARLLAIVTTPILSTRVVVIRVTIRKVLNVETIIIIRIIKRKLSALTEFI